MMLDIGIRSSDRLLHKVENVNQFSGSSTRYAKIRSKVVFCLVQSFTRPRRQMRKSVLQEGRW